MSSPAETSLEKQPHQSPPPINDEGSNNSIGSGSGSGSGSGNSVPTIRISKSFDKFESASRVFRHSNPEISTEAASETDDLQMNRSFSADDLDRVLPLESDGGSIGNGGEEKTVVPRLTTCVASVASGEILLPKADGSDIAIPPCVTDGDEQTLGNGYIIDAVEQHSNATAEVSPASSRSREDENIFRRQLDVNDPDEDDSGIIHTNVLSGQESSDDEEDPDVVVAREMALAFANNPGMTKEQVEELKQQVQDNVEERRKERKKSRSLRSKSSGKSNTNKQKRSSLADISKENWTKSSKMVKDTVKGTIKETKQNFKVVKNDLKKGLMAIGLVSGSTTLREESGPSPSIDEVSRKALNPTVDGGVDGGLKPSVTTVVAGMGLGDDGQKVRLAGVIWKRRSGFGKYYMTGSWERRRVVLKGTKLIYYKTLHETLPNSSDGEEEDAGAYSETEEDPGFGAWINTFMEKNGVVLPRENSGSRPGARGYLDLRKEKASAAASYGHTGAPTPFALSIKIAGLTKYKFCFDTQNELMTWLAAITDVVVAGSVDNYNAEILEANDPSSHGVGESSGGGDVGAAGTWQEPPLKDQSSGEERRNGGHQLWSTEDYLVKSAEHPRASGTEDEESDSELEMEPMEDDYFVDTSLGQEIWGLPVEYLKPAFYAMNAVILSARSQTALTDDNFWYVLVFFNVIAILLVEKVMIGGAIQLKPGLRGRRKFTKKQKKQVDTLHMTPSGESADGTIQTIASAMSDEHFVPPAGSTSMRIENPKDLPEKDGVIFAGWRQVDPADIPVRGASYKTSKKKVPCPGDLYECIELDVFESKKRVPDMAGRVILPTVTYENDDGPKTWNAPDLFVITVALPTDPPKPFAPNDNGGGYTITMYCAMRQKTRDILRRITADGYNPAEEERNGDPDKNTVNAARLLDEWCRRAPSDDNWMARFKVIPQGNNLEEIGLPSWISNYNGKPFLIKRPGTTGFLYRHPEKSCMEFDVSLHPFPFLAKQGICYMKDGFFKKILATLAFCIEGRTEDELPECLIGLFQLCYPDPIHATQAEDFFAGKSARSK
eukprot:CAMPEP_0172359158 /NCGR_PEP_ID=MMETSP1060-20121228/3386_1 /TAXON_ID=37318 /ORGANISM="Pseudo-nitzschia pungens, Strain cf. cingulata" /LENGTH=1060 /DNA_ID=CAMNT_0013080677 /DNA_START=288 /DNA_END=3470 /DNA_ORIENTATION=+